MRITGTYYFNNNRYDLNNKTNNNKFNSYPRYFTNTNDSVSFKSDSVWDNAKSYVKEKAESVTGFFTRLFGNKTVDMTQQDIDFIRDYQRVEEEIKEKYDKQIAAVKDGFWDRFFSPSENKRQKLRTAKENALAEARKYQELFEQREKESLKVKEEYYKLACQLNLSKEILIEFENAQAANLRRLEIINRRKEIMDKTGFSQIGGYQSIKSLLQETFIDKLDDEKAGKFLDTPIPNAILLYGPTGCGKTTFAKALAQETDCKVITINIRGKQKEKEEELYKKLMGGVDEDDFGNEVEVAGLLEKAQQNFLRTQKRTIVIIDEFDRFFGNGVSPKFVNTIKGILGSCSEDNHVTFILTTNNPQRIPYEIRNAHRIGSTIPMAPPNRDDARAVLEHYLSTDERTLDYDVILNELFKYAPNEVYSNTHLRAICELAQDIAPENSVITTQTVLDAIKQYNDSSDDANILRITKKYLDQFEDDKANM